MAESSSMCDHSRTHITLDSLLMPLLMAGLQERNKSPETTRLHVGRLTRNVTEEHVREIFSLYGQIRHVQLAMDERVHLPKGYAFVDYADRQDAEKAKDYMDGGQLDGNILT